MSVAFRSAKVALHRSPSMHEIIRFWNDFHEFGRNTLDAPG